MTKKLRGSLLLLLTAFIWGTAFVAQSAGMDHVGPFTFLCIRSFLGAAVLLPLVLWQHKKPAQTAPRRSRRTLLAAGGLCGVALCVASALQQVGIQDTTVGKAGFITALYIVLVPLAGLLFGKKPRPVLWIGVALAAVGLYLLCMTGGFGGVSRGDVLELLCAVGFTAHILIIDHFSGAVDGVKLSCIQFFTCGLLSGIVMLAVETPTWAAIWSGAGPILYAGVLSSGVGYTLQIIGQQDTEPAVASLLMSLESVFSAISGWVILGQALSARELGGCILMFAAIVLVQLPRRGRRGSMRRTEKKVLSCPDKGDNSEQTRNA